MDDQDEVRALYNTVASASLGRPAASVLQERSAGPMAPMKAFHNHIKKLLLYEFAGGTNSLLDLCCGRGGDLFKWNSAGIRYVKGLDFAKDEIAEAVDRYQAYRRQEQQGRGVKVDFDQVNDLKRDVFVDVQTGPYDCVSCMFALQYFFADAQALRTLLTNVVVNLRPGGYFIGTVPDGRSILDRLAGGSTHTDPCISIQLGHSQGQEDAFGQKVRIRISDTVTDLGSPEFLVSDEALMAVAAEFNLHPILTYESTALEQCLGCHATHPNSVLRPFNGTHWYKGAYLMDNISQLFSTFVFQKSDAPWCG